MNLAPLFNAPLAIQIHVYAAVIALVLGLVQFLGRKGNLPHRLIGWFWIVLLSVICISSFWIPGSVHIGPISLFHVIALYTLWSLFQGARAAMRGDVADHKSYMAWIFGLSLVVSAVLAFAPGALLFDVIAGRR
jgi:uncharacterized membrane protein